MKDDIQLDISARHIIILSTEDVLSGDQLSFFGFFICLLQQNTQALLLHKQGNWWLAMGISRRWVWWGYGCRRTLRRDNWGDFSSPPGTTTTTSTNNSNKQTGECPSLELSRWDCVPHITTPLKEPCHGIYRNSNRETRLVWAVSFNIIHFCAWFLCTAREFRVNQLEAVPRSVKWRVTVWHFCAGSCGGVKCFLRLLEAAWFFRCFNVNTLKQG